MKGLFTNKESIKLFTLFKLENLKSNYLKGRKGNRERERDHPFPKCLQQPGLGQG